MKRVLGFSLFALAIMIAIFWAIWPEEGDDPLLALLFGDRPSQVDVLAYAGGEKIPFLENPKIKEILEDRYGINLDARKAGSIEMVQSPDILAHEPDVLWPASQLAADLAKASGLNPIIDEIIFNSPIVFYTWSPVAEALVKAGLARPIENSTTTYAVDSAALLEIIQERQEWGDFGLDLHGTVMLFATDPTRSNSGNQTAALLLTLIASSDDSQADPAQSVAGIFERMGYLEHSSGDIFEQFLRIGLGGKPIVAGYENQLVEFVLADPERYEKLAERDVFPVIMYPEPTVISSHVALALTEEGRRLVEALEDPELQNLAWSEHGFRSGLADTNDPALLPIQGVPSQVTKIVPIPPRREVEHLLSVLGGGAS